MENDKTERDKTTTLAYRRCERGWGGLGAGNRLFIDKQNPRAGLDRG